MTDHPMSCYPGHLSAWRPHTHVLRDSYIAPEDFSMDYDGLERYGVGHFAIIMHSQIAICRAKSGQITSSTGDKP